MKNDRARIIKNATFLFSQHGTQSVSMDDIAGCCGISKKKIYTFFDSKEMLTIEIVKEILSERAGCLNIMSSTTSDVLLEMCNFHQQLQKTILVLTPSFIREVKKYYPAAYDLFVEFREKIIAPFVTQNIIKGVAEKIYRQDVDPKVVGLLYCWQLQNIYESISVPLPAGNLLDQLNSLFLRGIILTTDIQIDSKNVPHPQEKIETSQSRL